jgi:hypothetical protein
LDCGVFHVTANATLRGVWVCHGDETGFFADVKFVSGFAASQFATENASVRDFGERGKFVLCASRRRVAGTSAFPADEAAEATNTEANACRQGDSGDFVNADEGGALKCLIHPGKELAPADRNEDPDGLVRAGFDPDPRLPVVQCSDRLLEEVGAECRKEAGQHQGDDGDNVPREAEAVLEAEDAVRSLVSRVL